MTRNITKVKKYSKRNRIESERILVGWEGVLADIRADIEELRAHEAIVQKKIEHGEPWPLNVTSESV